MSHYREFDYVVVNDDFEQAVHDLRRIIAGQGAGQGARAVGVHFLIRKAIERLHLLLAMGTPFQVLADLHQLLQAHRIAGSVSLGSIHVTLISWGRSICSSFWSCSSRIKLANVAFTSLDPNFSSIL
jgi:hypothetical protein